MEKSYENIVVGAGFAGLVCSGYLARGGQKTLLLEKGPVIGGRAAAHSFNGYNVVMHLPLVMTTLNNGGGYGWANAAKDFGANIRYHTSREPRLYFKGSKKAFITIPKCLTTDAATNWMIEFLDAARPDLVKDGLYKELFPMVDEILTKDFKQMCEEWDEISVKEWVEARSSNPSIKYLFTSLWAGCVWTGDAEFTWERGSMGKGSVMFRIWIGGQGLMSVAIPDVHKGICEPIANAITNNFGCEIRTSQDVSEVLIENGKTTGVAIKREGKPDEIIKANRVILATTWLDYLNLFKTMPDSVAQTLRMPLNQKMGGVFLITGLNDSITLDGAFFMAYDPQTGSSIQGGCAQNIEQPWNVPAGKQLVWSYSIRTEKDFNRLGLDGIVAEMNENFEEIYPGFKKAIEFQTPPKGAVHPSHYEFSSLPKIRQKSPDVEGLYFCGEATWPMYGQITDGTSSTGANVAKMILGVNSL
ncbi:MAG: NAD(P)/FAD-dependent oxidoreductase [Desulfobacterium sp.]|nr:NAD(P)/FAD-dependent oxidoreductase [Desulfobacterium sp.]MBU3948734.1 FAD-binding protein [Pseudomonadota bacterium]MBU4011055.1 FAD-binding protein [Pseudomonadota bacterium]